MPVKALAKWVLRSRFVLSAYEFVSDAWQDAKYDEYRERYDVSPEFTFNGEGILFYGDGEIVAGADSYIGRLSRISANDGARVSIGGNCAISHHVMVYTSNRVPDQDLSAAETEKTLGDVTIGDHCWIGANVFITEGVEIGENSVIGANSVVTDDIPPHSVAAGAPAKVTQFKSYLADDAKQRLRDRYAGVIDEASKAESG